MSRGQLMLATAMGVFLCGTRCRFLATACKRAECGAERCWAQHSTAQGTVEFFECDSWPSALRGSVWPAAEGAAFSEF